MFLVTFFQPINDALIAFMDSSAFLILKFIFLALDLFFIVTIVLVLAKTSWLDRLIIWDLKEYLTYRHYGLPRIEREWIKVKERLKAGTEPEAKLAIIEAESILDDILQKEGFLGKTFEERLEKLTVDIIKNLKELKEAHQVHINIVHDPTYRLSQEEAERVLAAYEKALVELQAL